jgi:hypothetical protein
MARARASRFEPLQEEAWRAVERWAASNSHATPVPLHDLAALYDVRRICFDRLFSSAGLSKAADGFVVYVNTGAYGVDQIAGTVLEVNAETLKALKPSVRFSVAHEIAHAIFLKETNAAKKKALFLKHNDDLESACNQMAGAMLLPKPQFTAAIGDKLFDANRVTELTTAFGVSATTLILRLKSPDMRGTFRELDGLLAIVEEVGATKVVKVFHFLEPYSNLMWKNLSEGDHAQIWEKLHLGSTNLDQLRESKTVDQSIRIAFDPNRTIACQLTSRRLRDRPLRILVGIRIAGHPEIAPT